MAGETPRLPKLNDCELVIPLQTGYHSPILIRVTPQHHNTYTPAMAHAWGRCWGVRGSLSEFAVSLWLDQGLNLFKIEGLQMLR